MNCKQYYSPHEASHRKEVYADQKNKNALTESQSLARAGNPTTKQSRGMLAVYHACCPSVKEEVKICVESVYRAFIELRKHDLMLGRRCNAEVDGYGNFVFVSGNGQPLAVNAVNNFLLNIERTYNKAHPEEAIPHLSAHILRHTGCTLLASAGMDIKALQSVMGHADAGITMNVYNHSSFERTEKRSAEN